MKASDNTESLEEYSLTPTGQVINIPEHAERIAQKSGTHFIIIDDFQGATALFPKDAGYVDPDTMFLEFSPNSRPGYPRIHYMHQGSIESMLPYFRN